jgi:hypothetical protein
LVLIHEHGGCYIQWFLGAFYFDAIDGIAGVDIIIAIYFVVFIFNVI